MLDKFIDREEELKTLETRYASGSPELLVVYGRRRVGKTELLRRFASGKPHIYFLADKRTMRDQALELSRKVGEHFQDETLTLRGFEDLNEILAYIARKVRGRIVLIVDELPYLVKSDRAVPSILQKAWDEQLSPTKIMAVLCGSSVAMMEREILGYKSPLYGRRTGQLLVEPLPYPEAREFLPRYNAEDAFRAYAILGGIPLYLNQFKDDRLLLENIKDSILRKDAFLYAEPEFLLREELREPQTYFSLLKYLSFGKSRVKELAEAMGMGRNEISRYLATLETLRLVEKVLPVTEKHPHKSRKGLYTISDPFLGFWFRFVYPNRGELETGEQDYVLGKIKPLLDQYVGGVFEATCRKEALRLSRKGLIHFRPVRVGRMWDGDVEIDLVALGEGGRVMAVEVKWSDLDEREGRRVVAELRRKVETLRLGERVELGIMARSSEVESVDGAKVMTLKDLAGK